MTIEEQQKQLDFAINLYENSKDVEGCIYASELLYQILKLKNIKSVNMLVSAVIKDIHVILFWQQIDPNFKKYNYTIELFSYGKLKVFIEHGSKIIKLNPNYKEDAD